MASVCTACQRLKESLSWAARKARSPSRRLAVSLTGAEKPRLSESTGRSGRPVKTKVSLGFVSVTTPRASVSPPASVTGRSRPSGPRKPIASGMTIGSLTGWPGVGGTICVISSVQVPAPASWFACTTISGVPAWLYQRMNWVKSRPEASAKQATNSSTVAARPSWRAK